MLLVGDRTNKQVRRNDQCNVGQVHFVGFAVLRDLLEQPQDLGQGNPAGPVKQQNKQIEYFNFLPVARNAGYDQKDLLQIIAHQWLGQLSNQLLEHGDHIENVELIEQFEQKRMQHLTFVVDIVNRAAKVQFLQFFLQ